MNLSLSEEVGKLWILISLTCHVSLKEDVCNVICISVLRSQYYFNFNFSMFSSDNYWVS